MRERQDILDALAAHPGEAMVLATVVSATGSTYRGPGAHLLVRPDGQTVGSVSGGCVEHDVLRQARAVLADGTPRLLTYDTTAEDDALWGMGLGCSGILRVLLERLPPPPGRLDYPAFLAACHHGTGGVAVTVFRDADEPGRVGRRLLKPAGAPPIDDLDDPTLRDRLLKDLAPFEALLRAPAPPPRTGRPHAYHDGRLEVLFEPLAPPVPLLVFGAGHDVPPLVRQAHGLGWRVTVVDPRAAYADPARLPGAADVLACDHATALDRLPLTPRTLVVVMTHQYLHDLTILRRVLPAGPAYVGLLGPTRRTARLLDDLRRRGEAPSDEALTRLFSPAGLDVGAETAEEVALSLVAEMQAVLAGRRGGFLRERTAPIHTR